MEKIHLYDVIEMCGGCCSFPAKLLNLEISGISTDSRTIKPSELYIALRGESLDGHDYISSAITNGAAAILASKPLSFVQGVPIPVILVEDTLEALWKIAASYLQNHRKPVIAVTGSVGKTSTKEMIASVLSQQFNTQKSKGNFNNQIGMPLSILSLMDVQDVLIVEMGMRGLGEIRILTQIAKPSIAVITNIGLSHIERLGSQANILRAKLEIIEGLSEDGILILNANDPHLRLSPFSIHQRIVTIGIETPADYRAYDIINQGEDGVQFKINLFGNTYNPHIHAIGTHHVTNALFGIACGIEMGMGPEDILTGIAKYQQGSMRFQITEKDGIRFIDDTYNASPDSMKAALQSLCSLSKEGRTFAVLGNMLELGEVAPTAHYELGQLCLSLGIQYALLMGDHALDVGRGIGNPKLYQVFQTHEEIVAFLKETLQAGDLVLLKGSRALHMEKVLAQFLNSD